MMTSLMKIIATLPTYNEADNIELLMAEILALGPEYEILVVDDDSPDGTHKIVADAATQNPHIHLIHRTNERGRGSAGLAAFRWARDHGADAVIAIAGPGDTLARSLAGSREKYVPTVVLALGETVDVVARRLGHPIVDTITDNQLDDITSKLGAWLADRISGKRLALASNFALVRRAVAVEAVKATSFQNAVIGAVAIIPGADLPIMTANQAKMVLQVAAAYGVPLGAERIKELAVVVGGAFTMRAIARQFLTLVPGAGWAIKGAMGYSGTIAMGYAAIEYFEGGADLSGLGAKLREARDKAVETAVKTRGRLTGTPVDEDPIPAHAYVVASSTPRAQVVPVATPAPTDAPAPLTGLEPLV